MDEKKDNLASLTDRDFKEMHERAIKRIDRALSQCLLKRDEAKKMKILLKTEAANRRKEKKKFTDFATGKPQLRIIEPGE